jgi:hypothetical protein
MLRESMWQEIDGIRQDERLASEADALRRVVAAGVKALKGGAP